MELAVPGILAHPFCEDCNQVDVETDLAKISNHFVRLGQRVVIFPKIVEVLQEQLCPYNKGKLYETVGCFALFDGELGDVFIYKHCLEIDEGTIFTSHKEIIAYLQNTAEISKTGI